MIGHAAALPPLTCCPRLAATPTSNDLLALPSDLNVQVADNAPQIMLLSNGDTNSFVLTIQRDSARRSVTLKSNSMALSVLAILWRQRNDRAE